MTRLASIRLQNLVGLGITRGSGGGGGASGFYWIGLFDGGIDGAWYDSVNNKIHISEGNTTTPKVVTLSRSGTIEAEKTGSYSNTIYEEFNNPNTFHEDYWYIATAHNGTGAAKTQYPFNSTTTYYTSLTSGDYGHPIYPTGDCEVAVTDPKQTTEVIHTIAGSTGTGGANTNEVWYSIKKTSSSSLRIYRITYGGGTYVRNYPNGCAASTYATKIGISSGLSTTGSGPYPACFHVLSFAPTTATPTITSTTTAKVVSNAANNWAYNMNLMSWQNSTRWLQAIRCDNGENTNILVKWDYNCAIRDQIAFDKTKASYQGAVFKNMTQDSGPYIIIMKDEVVANRYYLVNWNDDDNSTSTSGGSNTGGTWNNGSDAVQIDFAQVGGADYGSCNGKGKGYMISNDSFVLGLDIGPSGKGVLMVLPTDFSRIQSTSNSDFSITTGSSVNTTVNAMVNMSLQKTFSTVNVATAEQSSSAASTGVTLSSASWITDTYNSDISYTPKPSGEHVYTTSGTYSWTAPTDVTSVSVVAVGGGGTGTSAGGNGYGSGGGGLGWKNSISVTPGNSYTVVVDGGADGGSSYFINTSTVAGNGGSAKVGGTYVGDGGGNGGSGSDGTPGIAEGSGGGAGGYSGNGGNGGYFAATAGQGGAGGGGSARGGGGVGLYGEGTSGAAGDTPGGGQFGSGAGGSGGEDGADGGLYGSGRPGTAGRSGAVRIIWGDGRSFPSINTDEASSDGNVSTN